MVVARIEVNALPPAVGETGRRLAAVGGRCWLVGGTVRDLLLGIPPRDFDLATDLSPARVVAAMPEVDARDAGLGVCRLITADLTLSITTLRSEAGYSDHRRPDRVVFVDEPHLDACRRDFTVNAIYCDLASGQLLDPTHGIADLQARRLRTIGPAAQRFAEDALRLLRLVRFAARCELDIDDDTARAATAAAPMLATLSAERVYGELTNAFTSSGRGRALRLLVDLGLAAHWLPEVAAMHGVTQPPEYHPEGDVLTHVCLVLDQVPQGDAELAWSAVLHDVGKPPTWRQAEDRIRFDGHDTLSATMADSILQRLRAPTRLREHVIDICRHHIRFAALPQMRPVRAERWLRSSLFPQHLAFHRADCLGSHGNLTIHDFAAAALQALPPQREPLLEGRDVLALGIEPGPIVGQLLRAVDAAAEASDDGMDRSRALVLLRDMAQRVHQGWQPDAR